ncbi:MAG: DUF2066 domain-containing protein [Rhodospirillales bacterium]|nr:DUF2066 domain-containing protein [Rhodospirillales bacterium]
MKRRDHQTESPSRPAPAPRWLGVAATAVILAAAVSAKAEVVADLYRGQAIVTGREIPEERLRGFREALAEVLVKVSGESRVLGDPRLPAVLEDAPAAVVAFSYEDRLAKKKLMDEQGTRERSYLLRVDFAAAAVDQALARLGASVWPVDRPRVLVLLGIRDTLGPYLLETESPRGYGQREALLSLASRRGIPVVLPETAAPGTRAADGTDPLSPPDADVRRLQAAYAAQAVLTGAMTITPAGVWDTRWTLLAAGGPRSWQVSGTTFDRAIADGLGGAARHLADLD